MCGIAGIIYPNASAPRVALEAVLASIDRRGPDAQGSYRDDRVDLFHTRLSIIDLSTGAQPMQLGEQGPVIVFNGEIYNFQQLRKELVALGADFRTQSDTEVLLWGYQIWGFDRLLERIEGMFAFALYDRQQRRVYVVRDRYGEKPLYYSQVGGHVIFGSTLAALRSTGLVPMGAIDPHGLGLFLQLSYIPAPYSIHAGVRKLPQGHYLCVDLDVQEEVRPIPYYRLREQLVQQEPFRGNFQAAKDTLVHLTEHSVRDRMIADVPVGAFLSGGIDSSIVAAVMTKLKGSPIHSFTIGFELAAYDERERARLVAKHLGSIHHERVVRSRDLVEVVDRVLNYFDEPFGDSSAIPMYFVAELAKEEVKVVLSGDAADECFGGYEKYLAGYYQKYLGPLPSFVGKAGLAALSLIPHTPKTNHSLRKAKKLLRSVGRSSEATHYDLMCMGFRPEECQTILQSSGPDIPQEVLQHYRAISPKAGDPLAAGFYTDLMVVLQGDMLPKVDRMSMYHGIEARVPFLDRSLVHFSQSLPLDYKISGGVKKRILREAFRSWLPEETFRFGKQGFGMPLGFWFRNELRAELTDLLHPDRLRSQGIFYPAAIQQLLDQHFSGRENHGSKLWILYVFQKWWERERVNP